MSPSRPPAAEPTHTWDAGPEDGLGARQGVVVYVGSAAAGGAATGDKLVLVGERLEIGRRPENAPGARTWELPDPRISGRHARISRAGGGFNLSDLQSHNGTLLDGRPLLATAELRDGALMFFAGHGAAFRLLDDGAIKAIREDLAAPFAPVPTASGVMALAIRKLRRLAAGRHPILLNGETGVGKDVLARAVHRRSGRSGPFVAINCAALPAELVESELYGYSRGAHSQAFQAKKGLIEQADQGTLFLDEIGDMPLVAQAKLLRFLETGEFVPLGATRPMRVEARIIAATSQTEASGTAPGVRADLAGRLSGEPIAIPPLRERREDVGALVAHFLGGPRELAPSAFLALCLHDWPRNVRELERIVQEAAALADGDTTDGAHKPIGVAHLPAALTARLVPAERAKRRSPRTPPTREELEALMERHEGNVARVAQDLDRQWAVVFRLLKRYGIDPDRWRP